MNVLAWLSGIATWISQGLNVILLRGSPDMTVSARCHLLQHQPGWKEARRVINGLFFWQDDHCRSSFRADLAYAQWVIHRSQGRP